MKEKNDISTRTSPISRDDEIDLIELAKVIWSKRIFMSKVIGLFIILGLVIAFTSPEEYQSSSILIPEAAGEEGKLGGSLGGLASLAGVELGSLSGGAAQTINPALYQSVSRSTPFLMELMGQEYYFSEIGESISVYDYYMEHFKTSLLGKILAIPGTIIGWVRGSDVVTIDSNIENEAIVLTKDQFSILENLKERVFVEMDWDLSILNIQIEMQDPMVAAQMVQFTQEYITSYVTEYAISKSQQQLASLEQQYQAKKNEFEAIQMQLASFRDRNQNVTTARARSEEERLQSAYNLTFNVYNQLAQQREAIKLQIQENTPVFTVLEPVKVPVEKSEPKRGLTLIVFTLLGSFMSILIIVFKNSV